MKKYINILFVLMFLFLMTACKTTEINHDDHNDFDEIKYIVSKTLNTESYEIVINISATNVEEETVVLKKDQNKSSYQDLNTYEIYVNLNNKLNKYTKKDDNWVLSVTNFNESKEFYHIFSDLMFIVNSNEYVLKETYLGEFDEFFNHKFEYFELLQLTFSTQNRRISYINYSILIERLVVNVSMNFKNYNNVTIEIPSIHD